MNTQFRENQRSFSKLRRDKQEQSELNGQFPFKDSYGIRCIKCNCEPNQEFIILLCDHLVCGDCLNPQGEILQRESKDYEEISKKYRKHIRDKQTFGRQPIYQKQRKNAEKKMKLSQGYSGIKCPCGVVTYFKSSGEIIHPHHPRISKLNNEENLHELEEQQYFQSRRSSTRPSTGLIYSRNTVPTVYTHMYPNQAGKVSRIHTEAFDKIDKNHKYDKMCSQNNWKIQKGNKYNYQKNQGYEQIYERPSRNSKPKHATSSYLKKMKTPPKHQMMERSLYSIQNIAPTIISIDGSHFSTPKEQKYSNSGDDTYQTQLIRQLEHLRHQFEYHAAGLQKKFQSIIRSLYEKFKDVEENIKDVCLSNIVRGTRKAQNGIELGRIVKLRYENQIQRHIETLSDYLSNYYNLRYEPSKVENISQSLPKSISLTNLYKDKLKQRTEDKNQYIQIRRQNSERKENQQMRSNQFQGHSVINIYAKSPIHQYTQEDIKKNDQFTYQCEKHRIGVNSKKLQKKAKIPRRNVIIEL